MCVVSAMGDHYGRKWGDIVDPSWVKQIPPAGSPEWWKDINPLTITSPIPIKLPPTREEFDALKKEVEEMKQILLVAKEYDERTNQSHCELEAKVKILRAVADAVGVDLSEVFGKEET